MLLSSNPMPLSEILKPIISFIVLFIPSTGAISCGSRIILISILPLKSSRSILSSIAYIEFTTASNKGISGCVFGKSKFLTLPARSIVNPAITASYISIQVIDIKILPQSLPNVHLPYFLQTRYY